jgi:hypothetical protein
MISKILQKVSNETILGCRTSRFRGAEPNDFGVPNPAKLRNYAQNHKETRK